MTREQLLSLFPPTLEACTREFDASDSDWYWEIAGDDIRISRGGIAELLPIGALLHCAHADSFFDAIANVVKRMAAVPCVQRIQFMSVADAKAIWPDPPKQHQCIYCKQPVRDGHCACV